MTHDQPLRRIWGQGTRAYLRAVRTYQRRLHSKLGEDASTLTYFFTKGRVGYWMEKSETLEQEEA